MSKNRVDVFTYGNKKITIETEFIGTKSLKDFYTEQAMKIVNEINNCN
jgi:hypothetical protein